MLYEVDGVARTLAGWAKAHASPKTTLYSRVIERGMSMPDALKLGSRSEKKDTNKRRVIAADTRSTKTAAETGRAVRGKAAPKPSVEQ